MPKFTKMHYEMVADVLINSYDPQQIGQSNLIEDLTEDFITMFKHDNPAFKPEKFRDRVNGL